MANHDAGHSQRKLESNFKTYLDLLRGTCGNVWIGGKKGYDAFKSAQANCIAAENWWTILAERSMNVRIPRLVDMPSTVNNRVVAQSLFSGAEVTAFDMADNMFMLPGLGAGNYNVNGDALNNNVFGRNGFHTTIDVCPPGGLEAEFLLQSVTGEKGKVAKGYMIWENELRKPVANLCMEFSQKIADAMRTMDISMDDLKHPRVFTATTPQEVEAIKDYIKRRNNNEEWIDVSAAGTFNANNVGVIEFQTTDVGIRDCTGSIEWLMNLFDEILWAGGVSNIDKKAQMSVTEASRDLTRVKMEFARHKAYMEEQLDEVNKIFGTHGKWEWGQDLVEAKEREEAMQNEQHKDTESVSGRES